MMTRSGPSRRAALPALAALSLLIPGVARADRLDDLVTAELARSATPGAAIAVVAGGQVRRVQAFGLANLEHHAPVHADTLFKTGALGTQFTAAAIMLLVEDGRIALDAPVGRYLPRAPAKWGPVTIRQLLEHTSGLPATPNGDFRVDYSKDQLLDIVAAEDLNFPAGTRWRFSYAGYIVLGFVIEEVTGEPWTRFMAKRLFAPLGMATARGIDELQIIPNRAAGYEWRESGLRNAEWISQTANSTADGSLYLSALDYAAWAQALSQRRLLAGSSWDALARPARLGDGSPCRAVPGWSTIGTAAGGHPLWRQQGSWQGFQSYALRVPDRDLTVAVFANGEKADVARLARAIAGAVDPAVAAAPAQPLADADPALVARTRALLAAIAAGKTSPNAFADYARLDYTELTALYADQLAGLGTLAELALFERAETCGGTAYRFRARYAQGLVEIRVTLTAAGKVADLEITPLTDWADPL